VCSSDLLASDNWIANAGLDGIQDRQIQSAKVQTVKVKPTSYHRLGGH
jgi:hypothetical protein